MMTSVVIRREWFEEIKNLINYNDPYFFEEDNTQKVELDVNEEQFNKVSKELGWML